MQTRAAIARTPGARLSIETVNLQPPGPGEVLVRYVAVGLCHSDLHVLDGLRGSRFPIILGHEVAGHVIECGPGVDDLVPGDPVISFAIPHCGECGYCRSERTNLCDRFFAPPPGGQFDLDGEVLTPFCNIAGFSEYSVVPAMYLSKVRADANLASACCIGCGVATGVGAALYSAQVQPGSSVIVFGLGGIGLSTIQGARLAGAKRIIGVDTNPAKEAAARSFGMTDFVNPGTIDQPIAQYLMEYTGGGADFTFECVGVPALMTAALESTRPGWGLATIVGLAPDGATVNAAPGNFTRGRKLIGSCMGGVRKDRELPELVDWYVEGKLKVDEMISHTMPFEQINEGLDMLRQGKVLRAVLTY